MNRYIGMALVFGLLAMGLVGLRYFRRRKV